MRRPVLRLRPITINTNKNERHGTIEGTHGTLAFSAMNSVRLRDETDTLRLDVWPVRGKVRLVVGADADSDMIVYVNRNVKVVIPHFATGIELVDNRKEEVIDE